MGSISDVEAYRRELDDANRALVGHVRDIVRAAHPDLDEQIKWNGPSFAHRGEDRITLGIERKGGVRIVLHRGAKATADGFRFSDPDGLARWPAAERGAVLIADGAAAEVRAEAFEGLCRRWSEANATCRTANQGNGARARRLNWRRR